MVHFVREGKCDNAAARWLSTNPRHSVPRIQGWLGHLRMEIWPMPGGRTAASPYTAQCVVKLRVVRPDSGPLPVLLFVNFLATPGVSKGLVGRWQW